MNGDELDRAACRGKPTDWWMPFGENITRSHLLAVSRWRTEAAVALAICAQCPVIAPCRAEALREGERFAVRGGLTPPEMRKLAPIQPVPGVLRHGTESCYSHGCRLPVCRDAHAEYSRQRRAS